MKAMIECLAWKLGADVFFFVLYLSGSLALHYSWPLCLLVTFLLSVSQDWTWAAGPHVQSRGTLLLSDTWEETLRHISVTCRCTVWAYLSVTRFTFRWLRKQEVWLTPQQLKLQPFNIFKETIWNTFAITPWKMILVTKRSHKSNLWYFQLSQNASCESTEISSMSHSDVHRNQVQSSDCGCKMWICNELMASSQWVYGGLNAKNLQTSNHRAAFSTDVRYQTNSGVN